MDPDESECGWSCSFALKSSATALSHGALEPQNVLAYAVHSYPAVQVVGVPSTPLALML